jgi:FkbH-like protein
MTDGLTEEQVRLVYRAVLKREPESEEIVRRFSSLPLTLEKFIEQVIASQEFSIKFKPHTKISEHPTNYRFHNGANFLSPRELRVDERLPPRVLLIGSCFLDWWGQVVDEMDLGVETDRLHIDMHPDVPPPHPWTDYRFQICQVSLRYVLSDPAYFNWLRNGYADQELAKKTFTTAVQFLEVKTRRCCSWNDMAPIFFLNFLSPMHGVNGRLFGKHDFRDYRFFIRELNRELERVVNDIPNAYILDADECAGIMGRRFFQEESIAMHTHGGLLTNGDSELEAARIVKPLPVDRHYKLDQREFIAAVFSEADAAYRSLRGIGAVKMVCVDLDDTLWRGVLAEADYIDPETAIGGWPHGLLEALAVLKRRGILLCILSKNDERVVRDIWAQLYEALFPISQFAILKINWNSKADNLRAAMAEANILPNGVVFLDDNPVERDIISNAFPEVRVIHSSHYYWKRILMWSAETEGATITNESARRTEMVQAKIERDAVGAALPREQFLQGLNLRVVFTKIDSRSNPRFLRLVELVNKTNQFNTTGRRWTAEELEKLCQQGVVLAADVSDRFSAYGLVAVGLYADGIIEQIVMSCRVVGMEVELAILSALSTIALKGIPEISARTVETKSNLLSRDLYRRGNWQFADGIWRTQSANLMPQYIEANCG